MIEVEWNKERTWKVTREIKNGVVVAMKFMGVWYYPVHDDSGYDYMNGMRYIASDCCDNCVLENYCKGGNPIHRSCERCGIVQRSWH